MVIANNVDNNNNKNHLLEIPYNDITAFVALINESDDSRNERNYNDGVFYESVNNAISEARVLWAGKSGVHGEWAKKSKELLIISMSTVLNLAGIDSIDTYQLIVELW